MYFVAQPIVTNGLIFQIDPANSLCYRSGSNSVTSLTGNNITGSGVSNILFSNNNLGSFSFNGSNYITTNFKLTDYFSNNGDFSISIWFNNSSAANQTSPIGNSVYNTSGWSIYDYYGQFRLISYSGSTSSGIAIGNLGFNPDDTWVNYTFSIQNLTGSGYFNGSLKTVSSFQYTINSLNTPLGTTTQGGISSLSGSIGITQIYNRALSSSEIQQNFNALKGRYGL
jgi:hypothetical protein